MSIKQGYLILVNGMPEQLTWLKVILEAKGYDVATAAGGEDAFNLAKKLQPTLIISDVFMPKVNGIELCRLVRADSLISATPILLFNAVLKDSESIVKGLEAGANDYLEAPCASVVLDAKVRQLVGQRLAEESVARLNAILESSDDAIISKTLEGIITGWNPGAERLYGYTAAEAIGQCISIIIPAEASEELPKLLERISLGQCVEHFETVGLRKDGLRVDVSVTVSPILDVMGKVVGASTIGRDISALKRLEREKHERSMVRVDRVMKNAAAYAESIVETVREPLVVLTPDLHVKTANRAFYQSFLVTPEETEGMYFYELGAGQWKLPALVNLLEEILPQKRIFEDFEVAAVFPSIGHRIMLLNARQLHTYEEAEAGLILLAIEDITLQKETERKFKMLNTRLEQSNRELQDFASIASHDLQEPLRKIQAFGDRLKTSDAEHISERGQDYLERMQSAAGRMQRLISDLLSFSRVATKAQPFAPVDLGCVLDEVLSDMEVTIERAGAKVETGALPIIEADALQMGQLLQNLIGNALKYRRPGENAVVKIQGRILQDRRHVSRDPYTIGGTLCQIIVEDNGIGFEEKYLDRIFTVFERLHGRKEYEGTGIGLAVCRRIVERHSGHITAHSKPGQGANFIVTLPVSQKEST